MIDGGLAAGSIRRVEREFGQKLFTARVAGRNLLKLSEVTLADAGIFVEALKIAKREA